MTRSPFSGPVLAAVAVCALCVGVAAAAPREDGIFPHARHERLFPVCEGCHAGILSGDTAALFPSVVTCARCHDGTRVRTVAWRPHGGRASNLRFSHREHLARGDRGARMRCQACHATGDAASRMDVGPPRPAGCTSCHAHAAPTHLDTAARCTRCHLPVARATSLSSARIAEFPQPPSHAAADFGSTHGRVSARVGESCGVCHARQSCERCHANADRVPLVTALLADARVAALEAGKAPRYPTPASHAAGAWGLAHGASAGRPDAACANCHTRSSCAACHRSASGPAAAVVAALPERRSGGAPGVTLSRVASAVHPADIVRRHGTLASTGTLQCTQCHAQRTCAACHAGTDSRAFHVANFVERHAADVFANASSCQACHSTETFCRDCHARAGIAAQGRMRAAFHTGQPMWVLSHGAAARTGMESCASCHRQSDCVRCHSAVGGWRVNPHGPGFPASRLAARGAASCRLCHAGTPSGGGG